MSTNTSIRVVCRVRPLNRLENEMGGKRCVNYTEQSIHVDVEGEESSYDFTFDRIFGPETRQVDVFNYVALPVIDSVMDGFNGTIFAYGQTGSGKSFTMEGPSIENEELKGIIPRMMGYVFERIINANETIEFSVKVSFLEIYNEKIQDLLDVRKSNLQIKEDKARGIFVQDATEIYVNTSQQMINVMKRGSENRSVAATRMNEASSRSHSIFILQITQRDTQTGTAKTGKLYFIDLAGSEKIAKTNVTGQQLEEAKNINKSLTCLGKVINALTEKEKGFIPYRESKLTRMLQESLGGNSKTTLLLAASMCSYNDKETVNTLRFGNRAKNIKNCAVANVERSAKELKALLDQADKKIKEQDEIIATLQAQLDSGVLNVHTSTNVISSSSTRAEEDKSGETQPKRAIQAVIESVIEDPVKETALIRTKSEINSAQLVNTGHGSTSLTLLKQHIQITNLNEEIQTLKVANKELENELANKNKEVYELNDRVIHYEADLSDMSSKQIRQIREFQVNFEKICHENQTKTNLINKLHRELNRLKSDLNFLQLNKNMTLALINHKKHRILGNDNEDPGEDYIMSSIYKCLINLEDIENEFQSSSSSNTQEEIETMIEKLVRGPINTSNRTSTQPIDRESRRSRKGTEHLSTTTDEEAKLTGNTEESLEKKDNETYDHFRIETDAFDDDAFSKMIEGTNGSLEDKVSELQTLLVSQRRTILYLSKLNEEFSHANNSDANQLNAKIIKYKEKVKELQKLTQDRNKENDKRIEAFKSVLEEKINEMKEMQHRFAREIIQNTAQINELKYQKEKLEKIIMGNNNAKRIHELEQRIRDYGLERQKLFEDLFKLRKEVDEKDDQIGEKSTQISILQNSLNTLSNQLESLNYLKNASDKAASHKRNASQAQKIRIGDLSSQDLMFFDKHIINPIKGGGGNLENFERNNSLSLSQSQAKPTTPINPASFKKFDQAVASNQGRKFSTNMQEKSTNQEEDDDSILNQKLRKINEDRKSSTRGFLGNFFG